MEFNDNNIYTILRDLKFHPISSKKPTVQPFLNFAYFVELTIQVSNFRSWGFEIMC